MKSKFKIKDVIPRNAIWGAWSYIRLEGETHWRPAHLTIGMNICIAVCVYSYKDSLETRRVLEYNDENGAHGLFWFRASDILRRLVPISRERSRYYR